MSTPTREEDDMKITFDTRDKVSSSVVVGGHVAAFGIVRDVDYSDMLDVINIKWESLCTTNKLEIEGECSVFMKSVLWAVLWFVVGFAAAGLTFC